jgi:hypothetical protein
MGAILRGGESPLPLPFHGGIVAPSASSHQPHPWDRIIVYDDVVADDGGFDHGDKFEAFQDGVSSSLDFMTNLLWEMTTSQAA